MAHFLYDPYGEIVSSWIDPTRDLSKLDRLFTNQRYDADLGLYDFRARFYDPLVGQFTQPDSIVPDPLNPLAWNRFGYVYNNAVNFTDPSGHIPWDVTIDVASFGWSLYDFIQNPTWANLGWLALDTVGLLPLIPAVGVVRHAAGGSSSGFRLVRYGGRNLSRDAQRYRLANEYFGTSNVSVFKVRINSNPNNVNIPYGFKRERDNIRLLVTHADDTHSERLIGYEIFKLEELGVDLDVLEIFSEFHPCPNQQGYQYCTRFITNKFVFERGVDPLNVTYSFEYGAGQAAEAGRNTLKRAVRKLQQEGRVGRNDLFDWADIFTGR